MISGFNPVASATILLVDDSTLLRDMIRRVLEAAGYRVCEARDGFQALDLFPRQNFDLVLIDASLPDMDGFTTSRQLRALPGGERLPILMISGDSHHGATVALPGADVTDFLAKPFTEVILRQHISALLQAQECDKKL